MLVPEFSEVGMSALIKALMQVLDLRGLGRHEKKQLPALLRVEIAGLLKEGLASDTLIAAEALRRARRKISPPKLAARKTAPAMAEPKPALAV